MSHSVRCDNCGKTGRRRMGTYAPEGWFYQIIKDEDDPDEEFIGLACSKECCVVFWHQGPGKLDLSKFDESAWKGTLGG